MKQGSGEVLVNAAVVRCSAVLLLAAAVLTGAAVLRGAEYDEQYTLFLTAGVPRPVWPDTPFRAGEVQRLQAGRAGLADIARDLRATDVHPPLYFWAVAVWRRLFGPSLPAARMLSVACSLGALAAVGAIARRAGIPAGLAMLLTLGCYGFAYTGAIARGFALAQLLSVAGVLALLAARGRRGMWWAAGALFGAAAASNYLAVFVGIAALGVGLRRRTTSPPAGLGREADQGRGKGACDQSPGTHEHRLSPTMGREADQARKGRGKSLPSPAFLRAAIWSGVGFAPWLVLDLWFFLAQRGSRAGQFPPFHLTDALRRLTTYTAAALFGGLPLYVPTGSRTVLVAALAALLLVLGLLVAHRWQRIGYPHARTLLAAASLAPPLGLLGLGLAFNTTPIELRYLAFAAPFAALLLAGALASLPRRASMAAAGLVLAVQAAALAGLLTRPETMQPARAAARSAASSADGALVLLPRGNDGVGIVGAFGIEAPTALNLLVIRPDDSSAQIRARAAGARRVVLAPLAQDAASRAALPHMLAAFATPCWQRIASGSNLAAFERVCGGE